MAPPTGSLDARLCQVGGLNANYSSSTGTPYHIQVEDRGPLFDHIGEQQVRRLNVLVYANYGEAHARIVHSRDHDFDDVRTAEHNERIKAEVQDLAAGARRIIERSERRQLDRIKELATQYHKARDAGVKQELDSANKLFPYLVSAALAEIKEQRAAEKPEPSGTLLAGPVLRVYPMDEEQRRTIVEIERMIRDVQSDIDKLKDLGSADDIILQTFRKLVDRANDCVSGRLPSEFNVRRLELTRDGLTMTWRQVKSRLKAAGGGGC